MPTKCSYTTVNLNAGDNYILPAGAELVYVSETNNVTIPPDCNLTVPTEEAKRFRIQWEMDENSSTNSFLNPWEKARFSGVTINDVVYDFADIEAWYGQQPLANTLNSIGAPFWDYSISTTRVPGGVGGIISNNAYYFRLDFTALPSIAQKTIFAIYVIQKNVGTGTNMQIIPYQI